MQVAIIDNINQFPQFEAQNVFQTKDYMRLLEHEKGTKVVLFVVSQSSFLLIQPLIINRYYRHLPGKFASYAVAWREPWRNPQISDNEAQQAFVLLNNAIQQYCRHKALYLEYRHFSENNIYHTLFIPHSSFLIPHSKVLPWFNIYNQIQPDEDVMLLMTKKKRQQLRQSLAAGVQIEHNPTDEQIVEWYALLRRLYRRIHRPLPSLQLFLRLNQSPIGKIILITHKGRVISGCAMLVFKQNNSQLVYDWYRASIAEDIEGIYPSVVSTWSALQYVSNQGGGTFDFMGAGPQNKPYGVRDFKFKFGGTLTNEYRYRKYLL